MAKFQNRDRLIKKLKALPASMKADVVLAMESSAIEITNLMKHLAPMLKKPHKGRRPGELRDSIKWVRSIANDGSERIVILAGTSNPAGPFYARMVEFGVHEQTKGQVRVSISAKGKIRRRTSKRTVGYVAGQPFFYPAFNALRRKTGSAMTRAARKAIQKTARTP